MLAWLEHDIVQCIRILLPVIVKAAVDRCAAVHIIINKEFVYVSICFAVAKFIKRVLIAYHGSIFAYQLYTVMQTFPTAQ